MRGGRRGGEQVSPPRPTGLCPLFVLSDFISDQWGECDSDRPGNTEGAGGDAVQVRTARGGSP